MVSWVLPPESSPNLSLAPPRSPAAAPIWRSLPAGLPLDTQCDGRRSTARRVPPPSRCRPQRRDSTKPTCRSRLRPAPTSWAYAPWSAARARHAAHRPGIALRRRIPRNRPRPAPADSDAAAIGSGRAAARPHREFRRRPGRRLRAAPADHHRYYCWRCSCCRSTWACAACWLVSPSCASGWRHAPVAAPSAPPCRRPVPAPRRLRSTPYACAAPRVRSALPRLRQNQRRNQPRQRRRGQCTSPRPPSHRSVAGTSRRGRPPHRLPLPPRRPPRAVRPPAASSKPNDAGVAATSGDTFSSPSPAVREEACASRGWG